MTLPDPATEIRITALQALRGANFWSARPVTRMDLVVGAYEEISSADVAAVPALLARAMPGLVEHRCSIGERGGFLTRLKRGTYAPHIVEHVALELQTMAGFEVGYGKTRGGDAPGEYTLVFEHRHAGAGLRAAALALEIVQRAFAGTLDSVGAAVSELGSLMDALDEPPLYHHVLAGITGGGARHQTREELVRRGFPDDAVIADVSPAYILQAGLPFSRAELGIVLDAELTDVPERYSAPEAARKLMSVLADGLWRGGVLICPAREWAIQDYARDAECRVAVFAQDADISAADRKRAVASAWVENGHIVLESFDGSSDGGVLRADVPASAQVAAALAAYIIQSLKPELLAANARAS
jgi:cyanophycin synthetase